MIEEKKILIEFIFTLMDELELSELTQPMSYEVWLRYPISGIRQAASDMIEASQDINGKQLNKIDQILTGKGLPSLSKMREKNYKKILQIISRNIIKSENEWRLLKSMIDSKMLNEYEMSQAQNLINQFEQSRT